MLESMAMFTLIIGSVTGSIYVIAVNIDRRKPGSAGVIKHKKID